MLYTHVSHISAKIMHQLFCHLFSNNPLRHHVVHIRCDVTSTKEILSVIKRRITNHAIMHVSYQVRWHALTGSDSNMQVRRKSCWLSALQQLVSLGEQAVLHYLCYITFLNCGYIMLHHAVHSWSVWGTSHVTLWAKGLVIGQWYLDICTTIVAYYATGIGEAQCTVNYCYKIASISDFGRKDKASSARSIFS